MSDPSTLDFNTLRGDGIAMLQRLCSELWTDYNLHDPGVTILEQLVYGLTDMAYRTGFDVADYLTGPDGRIDFQAQALYLPEAILCSAPLTIDDYRRLLYDAVPELDDIWIRSVGAGLLAIDIMGIPYAGAAADEIDPRALEQKVRAAYGAHRTLGEDLVQVRRVLPQPYYLDGVIELDGDAHPAEILALVLFECGQYLASGLTVQRVRDVAAAGTPPERLFTGPATLHGLVRVRPDGPGQRLVTISELTGHIQRIDGVRRVRTLALVDAQGKRCTDQALVCDSTQGTYPVLPFPEPSQRWLRLQAAQGAEAPLADAAGGIRMLYEEALLELQKLQFGQRALRSAHTDGRDSYPLPKGKRRNLRAYVSIQEEFPAVYGVNRYGLPQSATPERQAQARQLKAYLFPFEQLMANYLENLQQLPALFAPGAGPPGPSYFTQYLDGRQVARIEELYIGNDPAALADRLRAALAGQDDACERKSRLYDYLLAMYGEAFDQAPLRRFNQHHPGGATDGWLLAAKARLIRELVELGGGRAMAFDTGGARPGAMLERRVAILLGCDNEPGQSLGPHQGGDPLELVDAPAHAGVARARPEGCMPVPPLPAGPDGAAAASPAVRLPRTGMPVDLFRAGAALAHYCLVPGDGETRLYCEVDGSWRRVYRHADPDTVVRMAHGMAAALATANRQCEGLHLVEHVLLRRRAGLDATGHASQAARLSIVMPAWTVRCAQPDFRYFAEETVREHCPAHLYPAFLWLAPGLMRRFEQLHAAWRTELQAWQQAGWEAHGAGALDAAGVALSDFLHAQRGEGP
jgi:hypothetical protein